jgi:hypothetical protein
MAKWEALTQNAVNSQLIEQLKKTAKMSARLTVFGLQSRNCSHLPTTTSRLLTKNITAVRYRHIESIELLLKEGLNFLPALVEFDLDVCCEWIAPPGWTW